MNVLKLVLIILAAICFGLDALRVGGRISWTPAGFCLLTISLL